MPTTTLLPTSLEASSGFSSIALADIDEDPDTPDAAWATANGNNINTDARVGFATPPGSPGGVQTFKVYVRKNSASGSGTPTARIDLFENGVLVASGTAQNVTSTTGQLVSQTFDLATTPLTDPTGAGVEARFLGTASGGGPSARASVDLGAINWDTVNYSSAVSLSRTAADSIGITDSAEGTYQARTQTVAGHPKPGLQPKPGLVPGPASANVALSRTAADTLGISDAATRTSARSRSATDSLGVSDAATRTSSRSRSAADSLGLSDAATRNATTKSRTAADTLGMADAATRTSSRSRSATDTLAISDSAVGTTGGQSRTAADSIAISDAATRTSMGFSRAATDALGISEVLSRSVQTSRSAPDSLGISDAATRTSARSRTATDSIGLTENLEHSTAVAGLSRTAADSITISDSAVRDLDLVREITDSIPDPCVDRSMILVRGKPRISIGGGMYV